MVRNDKNDQIFRTEEEKNFAILNKVKDADSLLNKFIPDIDKKDKLFFIEFLLWGLEGFNKLTIMRTNNGVEFKDPFNNFINKI